MTYEITNSKYEKFILNIKNSFNFSKDSIHQARNELKIIALKNETIIVKSFAIPNILRRIYYTYFRDSKAKKSYCNAIKIKEFTPKPIGYIEFSKNNCLYDSYFLSEKFDYDFTIRQPLTIQNYHNKKEILEQFAIFTYKLHENNIFHKDYSPGNILIKNTNSGYNFKIVDINRMEFKKIELKQRLINFSKLWASDEDLIIIINKYASLANEDEYFCIKQALRYSKKNKNTKNFKKRLKGEKVID